MLSTMAMAQAAEQQTRRCQFAAHGMQGEACLLFPAIALKSPWGRACCARPHGLHRVMSLVVGADGGPCGCGRCWSCGKVVKSYLGGRDRTLTHSKLLQRVSVLQQTSANFSRHALRSCPNGSGSRFSVFTTTSRRLRDLHTASSFVCRVAETRSCGSPVQ